MADQDPGAFGNPNDTKKQAKKGGEPSSKRAGAREDIALADKVDDADLR